MDVNDAMVRTKASVKVLAATLDNALGRGGRTPTVGESVVIYGRVSAVHEDGTAVITPEGVSG